MHPFEPMAGYDNHVRLSSSKTRSTADAVHKGLPGALRSAARLWFLLLILAGLSLTGWAQNGDFASLTASADAARQQGDVSRAIELYRKATEENPGWPDGWWFLGSLQYDQNQYLPAREALTRYLQLTPNGGPALALRGLCEFETGEYVQSLADLEQAESRGAANQPRNTQIILYHEALLLTHLGRFEEALGKLAILAKQQADNQDMAVALGLAGLRMNLFPKDVQPDETALLSSVGKAAILLMNQDYEGSLRGFQALFAQYPHVANIHYLYGYLLFPTKPDEAIEQFRQELAISPRSANAHAMYAWALGLQGNYAAALSDAAKAATEDPSLPMGQLVYGRALVETGDSQAGLPHLQNVLQTEPGNLEAHLTLAKAYSELGRSEDARRERLICLSISQQGATPVAAQ
ncbi:MAG TPA: tetratricopeptide repeat protein [Acidobacteriaceae bacterium]